MSWYMLGNLGRILESKRRADELAAPYRGRRGMRMTPASWIMTGGVVGIVAGILTLRLWVGIIGAAILAVGLAVALIEALIEARR